MIRCELRILKSEKLTDLPVMQSAKFQIVINFKSGLTMPATVLALADRVIG